MKIIDLDLYRARKRQQSLERNISYIIENVSITNLGKIKIHFKEWLLINRSNMHS